MADYTIDTLSFRMEDPQFETFKKKVDELNVKYNYWLQNQEDVVSGTSPANLHNYYFIYTENGRHNFNVQHMDDFPREIQEDLKISFKESYK